jgi:hypothetical protein
VITRSLHLRTALVLTGAALALSATSTASAQTAAPPAAGTAAPAPTTPAPTAPTAGESEDPTKKKSPVGTTPSTVSPESAPAANAPGAGAAPATSSSGGTTVTFGATPKKDEPSTAAKKDEPEPELQRFRGSLLIFDQSMTTNTLSKGSQLSYQPLYEWWISPRVAYNFSKTVRLTLRQDLFKEWTNVGETTDRGEWRYTDTWLTLGWRPVLTSISKHLTGSLGWVLRPGISKESRIASQYFATGPSVNAGYSFDLAGEKAKAFKSLNVSAGLNYQHAFSRCNTPCSGSFTQQRMNSQGQPVDDNQVRSGSLAGNQLLYSVNLGVDIVEHVDFSASMIWISQFANRTSAAFDPAGNEIPRSENDTRLRQFSWFFTQVTWGFTKEASLAFGYYNLNNVLAADGKYRNPFWSPEARVFLDVYIHLDAIYEKLTGGEGKKGTGPTGGGRVL